MIARLDSEIDRQIEVQRQRQWENGDIERQSQREN